jgi:membrane protein implicated in regulation of membrane protease activity
VNSQETGKLLVMAGALIVLAGGVLWSGVGKGWLGRLPGDIHYEKPGMSFHFPIVTCLIVSVVISLLLRLFRK